MPQKRTDAERVKMSVFVTQELHTALRLMAAAANLSLAKLAEACLEKAAGLAQKKTKK